MKYFINIEPLCVYSFEELKAELEALDIYNHAFVSFAGVDWYWRKNYCGGAYYADSEMIYGNYYNMIPGAYFVAGRFPEIVTEKELSKRYRAI